MATEKHRERAEWVAAHAVGPESAGLLAKAVALDFAAVEAEALKWAAEQVRKRLAWVGDYEDYAAIGDELADRIEKGAE